MIDNVLQLEMNVLTMLENSIWIKKIQNEARVKSFYTVTIQM